jgi:two-component SAPR family response regulator
MAPGVYANFGVSGLADVILFGVLMSWLSFYKRRTEKKYIGMLKRQKSIFEAKTFGNFTLMFEGKVVKFSRSKSNELIAYLIYKNGSSVNSKELIAALWGEHAESPSYGSNLRNLIVDIKRTFSDLEINSFFITEYNSFRIKPEFIKCDYYDFLAGDKKTIKKFAGEFMSQFAWAEEEVDFLKKKALNG